MRPGRCVLVLLIGSWPAASPAADLWSWLKKHVFDRVELRGYRTLGLHSYEVDGDRRSFELLNNYGEGGKSFTDIGSMSVAGTNVAGVANFRTNVDTNRFRDPQTERFSLDYDRKPLKVSLGDIQGSLTNTNRFASFNKTLKGASAQYSSGRFTAKGLYSEAKGDVRTISIQGNNSSGPFYLQASQVIWGSEQVRVDGQEMALGRDYTINYQLGAITFVDRIIAPTSTIVVSFEALGFNSRSGTIRGAGLSYDMGQVGRIGLTVIEQIVGGGSGLGTRSELFQGAGAPSTPYFLQFEPLTSRPITVRLDGQLQVQGVDYVFDDENPTIFYFTRFIPLTSTIDVRYTPRPTQTLDGDRKVVGIDYRIPLGKGGRSGYIALGQAAGELRSEANPLEGTARGIEASYRSGSFEFRAGARRVPEDFVSVETRGFNRNEDAADLSVLYSRGPLEIETRHNNSSIAIRNTSSSGQVTFSRARTTSLRSFANYRKDVAQPWSLEFARLRNETRGVATSVDSLGLFTSRTFGRLITRLGYDYQSARGPTSLGPTPTIVDILLKTLRLDTSYTAGDAWAFGAKASISDIETDDEDGKGTDLSLTASYEPSARFTMSAGYSVSDSGELATLGAFQNGFGLGYNGNGFSGGSQGSIFATGATDFREFRVSSTYQATSRLALMANYIERRSVGSVSSNSDTSAYTLQADFDAGNGHVLGFGLNQSRTTFVDSPTKSDALSWDAYLVGSPKGRWSYRFGLNGLITGGTSEFKQDGLTIDASLTFRINPRQRLTTNYTSGRTVGYLGQSDTFFGVSYEYQLYRNIALVGSYKFRDVANLDSVSSGGAYRASGFDLELTFNFVP